MRAVMTVVRLFVRPLVLWNAFVVGSLTIVMCFLFVLVRVRGAYVDEETARRTGEELLRAFCNVQFPMALGVLVSGAVFELLVCSFAPHLPRLWKRLYVALIDIGLVVAAFTALLCNEWPGVQMPLVLFACAFLAFALGVLWTDPVFATLGAWCWLLQVLALAPIFLAPELLGALERFPLVLAPLAFVAGVAILALPFHRSAMRIRATAEECARGRAYGAFSMDQAGLRDRSRPRVRWQLGRTVSSATDHVRAILYETFGNARGGWIGGVVAMTALWTGALAVLGLALGFTEDDGQAAARSLYSVLVGSVVVGRDLLTDDPVAPFPVFALPIWAAIFLLSRPFTFTSSGLYPVARARRAEAAWRASATMIAAVSASFALLLFVTSELAFGASGLSVRARGIPEYLHVAAAMAVGLPLVQAVRLHWIDSRAARRTIYPNMLGLLGLVVGLPVVVIAFEWRAGLHRASASGWLALVVAQIVVVQLAWRAWLVRHHARNDLVA